MSIEKHVDDWSTALKRDIGDRRNHSASLQNMLAYVEMTPDLLAEIAMFNEAAAFADRMAPTEIDHMVDRLAEAAKRAGPNATARAMLLD